MPEDHDRFEDLEFPIRGEPAAREVPVSVDMILAASEEFLSSWSEGRVNRQGRSETQCHVPFVLQGD